MQSARRFYHHGVLPRQLSPRIEGLIREGAWIALHRSSEWIEEFDRFTLTASPIIAQDAELAAILSRSNHATMIHFVSSMLRNPSAAVAPNIGPETLNLVRELNERGVDAAVLEIYRTAYNLAWRRWTEIVFDLTSDPEELRELNDVPQQVVKEFVDATLAAIATQMHVDHTEMTLDKRAERREVVELIIQDAPINSERAQAKLGYRLGRCHTAAIIWCDDGCGDDNKLERAVDAFSEAVGCAQPLVVYCEPSTRWVWVNDIAAPDIEQIEKAFQDIPTVRIAIGTPAPGIDGFRRSYTQALSAQRMVTRLHSPQRAAIFGDVQMVALLTENSCGANAFIAHTLGDFESASPVLHTTVLTYIKAECNASRAAKLLYTHRNTVLHRLETAQRLLPRPLDNTIIQVAVAIEALQWRGKHSGDAAEVPAEQQLSQTQ